MPSDRPMPIAPMPVADFTPTMRAYAEKIDPQSDAGVLNRAWTGVLGKAGPLTDLFLPFYEALSESETNVLGYKLTELVRLAVATTTRCEACLSYVDPRSGLGQGVTSLFDELEQADFTPRERAAIRYTIAFCTNHHQVDDAMWEELNSLFDERELMTLCLFVATYLGTGRLAHSVRLIDSHCTMPGYRLSAVIEAKAAQESAPV
jgi:alkylhydroperoxidase family enzyme